MGVFSVHMQKFKQSDVKGLEIEIDRKSNNLKNEDINYSLSEKNIDLITPKENLYLDIKNRVSELQKTGSRVQSNSITCAGFVFTLPEDIVDVSKRDEYFKTCVEYLQDAFKKENVIQAKIHLDESRPHLHVYLVPENKETGRLQARKSLNRDFLNDLHTKLPGILNNKNFNITRGDSTDKFYVENIHDYKKAMREIEELKKEIDLLKSEKFQVNTNLKNSEEQLKKVVKFNVKTSEELKSPINYTKIPFSDNVIIKESEIKKMIKVIRNIKYQVKLAEELDNVFKENTDNIKLYELIKNNIEKQKEIDNTLSEATELKISYENKFKGQLDLNNQYNSLQRDYGRLKGNLNLRLNEIEGMKKEKDRYYKLANNNAESFKNVVKAINSLMYDENYNIKLDKNAEKLINGLENYAFKHLRQDGYLDKAEEVKNRYGISKGISEEIKKLSKSRNMELEL